MILYVGMDDTDTLDSPGTNQLAKSIVAELAERFECLLILRHQLLDDPRVPYTSKNGSASILLKPATEELKAKPADGLCELLLAEFRAGLRQRYVPGSDPGLCVTAQVPPVVRGFGRRCQRDLVSQDLPRQIARVHGIRLEGLGGTEDGVIGALAAVGLAAGQNDGRVVKLGAWPDDLAGPHPLETIRARNVLVQDVDSGEPIREGIVDVGKHLRPNYRNGKIVLYVKPAEPMQNGQRAGWDAVRLP